MLSANDFNLDMAKILSSGEELICFVAPHFTTRVHVCTITTDTKQVHKYMTIDKLQIIKKCFLTSIKQ